MAEEIQAPDSTVASMAFYLEQSLRNEFEGEALNLEPMQTLAAGERGGIRKFTTPDVGLTGYDLFFLRKDAFVRLLVYGKPSGLGSVVDLTALAQVVDGRLTGNPAPRRSQ
jgi:hypothetical protein